MDVRVMIAIAPWKVSNTLPNIKPHTTMAPMQAMKPNTWNALIAVMIPKQERMLSYQFSRGV